MWIIVSLLLVLAFLLICIRLGYYYNYWKRKNIPYVPSSIFDLDWYYLSYLDYFAKIHHLLKGHKFGGFFAKFTPKLMVRDPELIKHILIKDFDQFQDRGDVVFDKNEPITAHLFSAPGPVWKNLRAKLTPTFTSGKMKYMFNLVEECAKEVNDVISKQIEINDTIDIKEFSTRYTIEVISSCAFGLKAGTIRDGNSIFKSMATDIFAPRTGTRFVLFTQSAFPWLKNIFKATLISKPVTNFFYKLTEDTINYRNTNSINRNDFLQLLINMRNNKEELAKKGSQYQYDMSDKFLAAQCFLFFLAGFDTSSMTLTGAFYELAANTHIQRKLQNEIKQYLQKNNNNVTYEMVNSMPYLNQVVSEALRKYPPLGVLNRVCVRRYKIPGTELYIEKGTEVVIPVAGLHSDPEYFPNPERFDPDRFEDPNYPGRVAYLPFGDGPRNCIGSRFAQMTVKLAIVYLLRDFNFEWDPMTRSSLQFQRHKIVTSVKREVFLKCTVK